MTSGGDSLANVCPRCGLDHGGERTPRSHRFLMAIIAATHENWPESHLFRPVDSDHLRAWLFAHPMVEFCNSIEGGIEGLPILERILIEASASGMRGFIAPTPGGGLAVKIPRSAAMQKNGGTLRKGQFYALIDRVLAAIEAETGIARQDLRREGLAAVAPRPKLGRKAA